MSIYLPQPIYLVLYRDYEKRIKGWFKSLGYTPFHAYLLIISQSNTCEGVRNESTAADGNASQKFKMHSKLPDPRSNGECGEGVHFPLYIVQNRMDNLALGEHPLMTY